VTTIYKQDGSSEEEKYWYHLDHLNSTKCMTNEEGSLDVMYEYRAFGEELKKIGEGEAKYTYGGKELDDGTNLYYFNARYYDATIGRYINLDPIQDGYNWYVYCSNNPLSFLDPTGLIPTAKEAAKIAEHVYDGKVGDKLSGGWEMIDLYESDEGSLQIGVYSRVKEDDTIEYIIANRGTTMSDMEDWLQNISQPFGASSDMKNSIKFAEDFVNNHNDSEITFVGHSKGGAEAAGNALATNKNALLFNPASINSGAYGLDSSKYTGDMTAYIVKGEILNLIFGPISRPIDEIKYLPSQSFNPIENHLMEAVRKGLENEE
jgi:RHS repeat-associated protein